MDFETVFLIFFNFLFIDNSHTVEQSHSCIWITMSHKKYKFTSTHAACGPQFSVVGWFSSAALNSYPLLNNPAYLSIFTSLRLSESMCLQLISRTSYFTDTHVTYGSHIQMLLLGRNQCVLRDMVNCHFLWSKSRLKASFIEWMQIHS